MNTEWRDIPGYTGYQASSDGQIRSIQRVLQRSDGVKRSYPSKVLLPGVSKDGYLRVYPGKTLDGKVPKTAKVHILVARTFIPNPNNLPQVNHKNGNKTDNRVKNLEWVTSEQNIRHAKYKLHRKIGAPCQRILCVEANEQFPSIREAWRKTGIHWSCIAKVLDHKEGRKTAGGYHWERI